MSTGTVTAAPGVDDSAVPGPVPLVVSVDELRALGRVTDAVLPALVTDDDAKVEAVDVAALRGLAARGLVAITDEDELWIADALLDALAPTHGARLVVEVDVDTGRGTSTWAALGGEAGPMTVITPHGPGLLTLEVRPGGVVEVVTGRLDVASVRSDAADLGFTVPRHAHEAMSDAVDAGSTGAAAELLVSAGAPAEAAEAFVAALTGRRRAVAVQVARNLGTGDDGPFEAAEVRWVEGPDGTAWRLVVELSDDEEGAPAAPGLDPEDDVFEARLAAVVATTGRAALGDAIRDALTPALPAVTTGAVR